LCTERALKRAENAESTRYLKVRTIILRSHLYRQQFLKNFRRMGSSVSHNYSSSLTVPKHGGIYYIVNVGHGKFLRPVGMLLPL
jgi:hypothetical protein